MEDPQGTPVTPEPEAPNPLYGLSDTVGSEKIADVVDIEPASYTGVIGKTYRVQGKDMKRNRKVTDVFLLSFQNEDGTKSGRICQVGVKNNKQHLLLRKNKQGELIVDNVIKSISNGEPLPTDAPTTQNFMALMKKKFAKKFNAFDEKTLEIDWQKIMGAAGRIISFNIVKDRTGKYLNIDVDSIEFVGVEQVSLESIAHAYSQMSEVWEKRKAAKASQASTAPDFGDTGIEGIQQPPDKIEDDLPF